MVKQGKNLLRLMASGTSKYHNKRVVYRGIKFDSKKEMRRYIELDTMLRGGLIKELELQKSFELQPSYKKNGKTVRAITYKADFYYYNVHEGMYIVEDTKGVRTEVYKIKKKMFEYKYPNLEIKEL